MGHGNIYGQATESKDAIAVIRAAFERGVTLFDTVEAYGPFTNESLVGEVLEPFRDQVVITTKFGFDIDPATGERRGGLNSRPDHIREVVEAALMRLQCCDGAGLSVTVGETPPQLLDLGEQLPLAGNGRVCDVIAHGRQRPGI